jgi:hypothetical protein
MADPQRAICTLAKLEILHTRGGFGPAVEEPPVAEAPPPEDPPDILMGMGIDLFETHAGSGSPRGRLKLEALPLLAALWGVEKNGKNALLSRYTDLVRFRLDLLPAARFSPKNDAQWPQNPDRESQNPDRGINPIVWQLETPDTITKYHKDIPDGISVGEVRYVLRDLGVRDIRPDGVTCRVLATMATPDGNGKIYRYVGRQSTVDIIITPEAVIIRCVADEVDRAAGGACL